MILVGIIVFLAVLLTAVIITFNKTSSSEKVNEDGQENEKSEEFILKELPEGAWEIQDNSLTDEWGVVLRQDQLPEILQEATSYMITVNGESYELSMNMFDENVFNGPVSNLEYTEEEVENGVITKND